MPSQEVPGLHQTDLIHHTAKNYRSKFHQTHCFPAVQFLTWFAVLYYSRAFSNLKPPSNTSDSVSKVRVVTERSLFAYFFNYALCPSTSVEPKKELNKNANTYPSLLLWESLTALALYKPQPYLLLFQPRGARFRNSHVRNWIQIGLPKSFSFSPLFLMFTLTKIPTSEYAIVCTSYARTWAIFPPFSGGSKWRICYF